MNIIDNRKPSAAEPENELVLPNLTDKAEHQAICVSILSLARSVGYENSLEKGKRHCFSENHKTWYSSGGILDGHKPNCDKVIQRNFFTA